MAMDQSMIIMGVGLLIAIGLAVWALVYSYGYTGKNTVETEDLLDGSVTTDKLADAAVTLSKIVSDFNRHGGYRYLEEYFDRAPGAASDYTQVVLVSSTGTSPVTSTTAGTAVPVSVITSFLNLNFLRVDVQGTNTSATSGNYGCVLSTGTSDDDETGLISRMAWVSTDKENTFETAFSLPDITTIATRIGLGLTSDVNATTDNDQAAIVFSTESATAAGVTLSNLTKMHFTYSSDVSGGVVDYITSLPITVAADTLYKVKIVVDSDRKLSLFVNDVQYSINNTSTDTLVSAGEGKSLAMKASVNLKAFACVQALAGSAARSIRVKYFKNAEKIEL